MISRCASLALARAEKFRIHIHTAGVRTVEEASTFRKKTRASRMWPSPTGERVGKRRHDADDVTVQEYMKRLRVTGSGASSPARAAISHPHPGLARAWATAQQQQKRQAAAASRRPPADETSPWRGRRAAA